MKALFAMDQTFNIEICQPGDEQTLALIGQATFLEAFTGVLPGEDILLHCQTQHSAEKYRSYLSDRFSTLWMAKIAGAPVGYLLLTTPDLPLEGITKADLEVKRVYLLHRFQGLGIGRRLMETANEAAISAGCKRLLLGVYAQNQDAVSFYGRIGYQAVGTRKFKVGSNIYDDLILGLTISH
jgi:diamine N-acetyltransferase